MKITNNKIIIMEDIKKQIELLSKKQEEILTIGIKKEIYI